MQGDGWFEQEVDLRSQISDMRNVRSKKARICYLRYLKSEI